MTRFLERASVLTFVPLALALVALGVRQATMSHATTPVAAGPATEFVPPELFLLATASPHVDRRFEADADRSTARVVGLELDTRAERVLRASGSVRILADETLVDLEVDLVPTSSTVDRPTDVALRLRGDPAQSRDTEVPGVRACEMRCAVVEGDSTTAATLAVTWIRLPGGIVELHAAATLDRAPFDPSPGALERMLRTESRCVLGIDLVLRPGR